MFVVVFAVLLFSSATFIEYHVWQFLSSTFFYFFISFSKKSCWPFLFCISQRQLTYNIILSIECQHLFFIFFSFFFFIPKTAKIDRRSITLNGSRLGSLSFILFEDLHLIALSVHCSGIHLGLHLRKL